MEPVKSKEPIRVVRIIARLNVGGPAVHCETLSKNLNRFGFETTLVAGSTEPGEASYEELFLKNPENYELVKLPLLRRSLNPFGDLTTLWKLVKILREKKPHIVHTHTAKAGFLGRAAAFLTGVPVVVHTYHGHVLSGYFSKSFSKFITFLERVMALRSNALVTLSPQLKNILANEFRVAPESKFHIVPLGRDLAPFLSTQRGKGKLRAELGINDETVLMGIIGRLVPIKDHRFLFEVLKNLKTSVRWKCLVVGEGPLGEELKAFTEASPELNERVCFLGWRKDLPDLYSDLDFTVLTSRNEGTPLSIIEAFAAGCPIISTDVGGVPDMLSKIAEENGVTRCAEGYMVPSQNAPALEYVLKRLIENEIVRLECSRGGRQRAYAYTEEELSNTVGELYKALLNRTAPV